MRRPLTTALVAALTIATFSTSVWAQNGISEIIPGAAAPDAVQALSQLPTVTASPATISAPTLQLEPAMSPPMMTTPTMSAAMATSPAMSYTGPVSGTYSPVPASNSYGPMSVGPYPQGRACCDLSPTPTVTPCLKPVTSCCSQNGRLGVPPLLTPIRYDMPPVGRSVGRPLFGKWNGF